MHIRDRIKELRRVRASELVPNPRNWRTHPTKQREALQGVLAEIGYADALLARDLGDGRLLLIDGHLRAETTPESLVPVLVLDVTEEEADKLLATIDPLATLAGKDEEKLARLLADIQTDSAALQALLDGLNQSSLEPSDDPPSEFATQFQILIACENESQQIDLLRRFSAEGLSCRAFLV